jgi:DNA-binding NarL/FixJ family response regulator
MNILLIDDHALFREGLRLLLTKIGHDIVVHESETLNSAKAVIKKTQIDLILLDLGLTESRGIETLQLFRSTIDTIPIVVLSGEPCLSGCYPGIPGLECRHSPEYSCA